MDRSQIIMTGVYKFYLVMLVCNHIKLGAIQVNSNFKCKCLLLLWPWQMSSWCGWCLLESLFNNSLYTCDENLLKVKSRIDFVMHYLWNSTTQNNLFSLKHLKLWWKFQRKPYHTVHAEIYHTRSYIRQGDYSNVSIF